MRILTFFKDSDNDDSILCAPGETTFGNRYTAWSPPLMKAAHNCQLHAKSPGGYAHNFDYMGQLLYDSVEDILGNGAGMTRPTSP